jgi:hypothetical protein
MQQVQMSWLELHENTDDDEPDDDVPDDVAALNIVNDR